MKRDDVINVLLYGGLTGMLAGLALIGVAVYLPTAFSPTLANAGGWIVAVSMFMTFIVIVWGLSVGVLSILSGHQAKHHQE